MQPNPHTPTCDSSLPSMRPPFRLSVMSRFSGITNAMARSGNMWKRSFVWRRSCSSRKPSLRGRSDVISFPDHLLAWPPRQRVNRGAVEGETATAVAVVSMADRQNGAQVDMALAMAAPPYRASVRYLRGSVDAVVRLRRTLIVLDKVKPSIT